MTYHWTVPLLAAVLNGALGAVVLRYNPRKALNRVFALLSLSLVLWHLNIFVLYFVRDADAALYWSRLFRVGTLMAPVLAVHLVVVFAESRSRGVWSLLGLDYTVSLFLVGANLSGNLVRGMTRYAWGYYPIGTFVYWLFPVAIVFSLALMMALLIRILMQSESPRKRQQAKLWIAGTVVAGPLAMTNLIGTFGIPFYPLGNLANVVYAGVIAYGILRYRLMDIDIVIRKSGAYTLVTLFLILPAFALSVWMQRSIFGRVDVDFSVALLLLFILVAALFPMLRARTETRIELSLFRDKHEYRTALRNFTRSIVRILDRDRLLRELATTLMSCMQLDRIAIALLEDTKPVFTVRYALGVPPVTADLAHDDELVKAMARRHDGMLRDELEGSSLPAERGVVAQTCIRNGWEVCIPLTAAGQVIGFLALGRKRNLDAFFAEDLDLLGTLAAEASVALENARLYEELKRSHDIIRRADRLSALGTLAAGIAHEIRNPLVSIQTFFQLAPQRLNDQEFLNEFLRLTSGEVKRITDLISELLSFARSPTPTMDDIDLNELLESVARLVEPQVKKGRIDVERSLDPELPRVRADRDQLKQVFLNIFLNALQVLQGSGRIILSSREVTHQGERFCQVQVTDSGAGIPEDLLDDIFNPFFTTKEKGTGLGLAISNQVVTEHGGFITVESDLGHGTSFFVHLRAVQSGGAAAEPVEEPRRALGGRMKDW